MSVHDRHLDPPPQITENGRKRAAGRGPIARIAVGVDGHTEARDAAALGAVVADVTGAELILVTVHTDPPAPGLSGTDPDQEAAALLAQLRQSHCPGARMLTEVDLSVPFALRRVTRSERCDLLVVGSSSDAGDGRVLIGRRTRQLLRDVDCALAIAPRGLHLQKDVRLRKIGVGYDGGAESEAALALARALAAAANADLYVRAVVDDRVRSLVRSALAGLVATEWTDVMVDKEERLRERTLAATEGIPNVRSELLRGHPSEVLLALSREVDLLVIGSRRWGPAARLVLGSTGEGVVSGAACPVLAVPRPAK